MIERIVLFGASGDLTARLLLPAFAQLEQEGRLPPQLVIVGSALDEWTTESFREHISQALAQHAASVSEAARRAVVARLTYRRGDVTDGASVREVIGKEEDDCLVYLALPSFLLSKTIRALSQAGLDRGDAVAIEKPFGQDLQSAKELNELIRCAMPLPPLYRIDHFLTDALVRRISSLRFMNRVFEPLLNNQHVDHVDIFWLESLALEGRAGYYDRSGALRDMVQNHLLEVLSLLVMEQPARFDGDSFRGNRVEALRAIPTPTEEAIRRGSVRGRYTAGRIGERSVPSYVEEPGVDPSRNTETYAAVTFEVRNNRWNGVPFVLRSGKALARDEAEIAIHFHPVVGNLWGETPPPNVLRIGLMEPYVKLATTVNGPEEATPLHQELLLDAPASPRSAYANLLLEMLSQRSTLFIRADEAEEAWRIVDPIVDAWQRDLVPMSDYEAGTVAPTLPRR